MLPEKTNLVNKLLKERNKTTNEEQLIEAVKEILACDELQRNAIKQKLGENSNASGNDFNFELLENDRIFHISHIKTICINYRLRFLDSNLFKATIPEEAVSKIKALDKEHGTILSGFKIMAPSKHFHLKNYDDPLLFAPIGNDYYYLIHKWGNDLSPYRKLLVRPLKDAGSLIVFIAMLSFIFALLIADNPFNKVEKDLFVLLAFLFTFKSLCGMALYCFFWRGKNFNTAIWNSEYYNK
jgi:hypothetical protein